VYECPPNGQGIAALIALSILSGYDVAGMGYASADAMHVKMEAVRLGMTVAGRFVADPDQEQVPVSGLLSRAYAEERRIHIRMERAIQHPDAGLPPCSPDTVYLAAADGEGNAVSFINSLYMGFGSGIVAEGTGIALQNRGNLFSLDPDHPNCIAPHKRPYHTIIPAMVTRDGDLAICYGVMGGFMQPQGHLQMLSNLVDLGYNPQQALDMPRFCLAVEGGGMGAAEPGGVVSLEEGFSFTELSALAALGHRIVPVSGAGRILFGGGQIILRDPTSGVLIGGSEPRKDGCALGY